MSRSLIFFLVLVLVPGECTFLDLWETRKSSRRLSEADRSHIELIESLRRFPRSIFDKYNSTWISEQKFDSTEQLAVSLANNLREELGEFQDPAYSALRITIANWLIISSAESLPKFLKSSPQDPSNFVLSDYATAKYLIPRIMDTYEAGILYGERIEYPIQNFFPRIRDWIHPRVLHGNCTEESIDSLPIDSRISVLKAMFEKAKEHRAPSSEVGSENANQYMHYTAKARFIDPSVLRLLFRYAQGLLKPEETEIKSAADVVQYFRSNSKIGRFRDLNCQQVMDWYLLLSKGELQKVLGPSNTDFMRQILSESVHGPGHLQVGLDTLNWMRVLSARKTRIILSGYETYF